MRNPVEHRAVPDRAVLRGIDLGHQRAQVGDPADRAIRRVDPDDHLAVPLVGPDQPVGRLKLVQAGDRPAIQRDLHLSQLHQMTYHFS